MREAELKHGRVSMLAVVGYLVQQVVHLPSPDGIYDVSNPIDAFFKVGPSVTGQVILLFSLDLFHSTHFDHIKLIYIM